MPSKILNSYIKGVQKQIFADMQMSDTAKDYVRELLTPLAKMYNDLLRSNADIDDLVVATVRTLPGELAKHAIAEGTKYCCEIHQFKEQFKLRLDGDRRLHCYVNAVLEYMAAELIELGGNVTHDEKKVTITSEHIKKAIAEDEELRKYVNKVKRKSLKAVTKRRVRANMTVAELHVLCKKKGIKGYSKMRKDELLKACK